MKRRQFLLGSALFVSGGSHALAAEPNPPVSPLPILDTHQHLWNLQQFRLPWLKPGGELTRNFLMSDYQHATEGLGVGKAIYMEDAVAPEQKLA